MNGLTLSQYLSENSFHTDSLKKDFIDPSIDSWNSELTVPKQELPEPFIPKNNEEEYFLKKREYLEYVRRELLAFQENSNVRLLILKINTFLASLKTKNENTKSLEKFCQLVEKKLKVLIVNIEIGKENGLMEDILSLVGNNSLRFQDYRIIQFQIVFIFLGYSKLKLRDLRTMSLEKLNSFLISRNIVSPKGIELLKARKELIEIFFEKHPYLGSCLKTKSSSLISPTSFSTMVNEELKRVLLILVKLKKYKIALDEINPMNLKYSLGDFNFSP